LQNSDNVPRILTLIAQPQYLNRYSYGLNNPLKFVDPVGEVPVPAGAAVAGSIIAQAAIRAVVGGAVGAVVGGGVELARQGIYGEDLDSSKIKAASADGAIFGAFVGAAGPIGIAIGAPARAAIVAGIIGGVTGGASRRAIQGENSSAGDVLTDAIAGGVGAGTGSIIGRITAPKYNYLLQIANTGFKKVGLGSVSEEGAYRLINGTANKLYISRSITNTLFDSQMGLRTSTFGTNIYGNVTRGVVRKKVKKQVCKNGAFKCEEVTIDVYDAD